MASERNTVTMSPPVLTRADYRSSAFRRSAVRETAFEDKTTSGWIRGPSAGNLTAAIAESLAMQRIRCGRTPLAAVHRRDRVRADMLIT
ncbi:hypothetical protein [Mycolicibacterium helvum]|uniref:hypothetical protein n=1 Tax=Mycolicibacterium helvum TaxID=1534349 RepID=UPI0013D483E0|nr:hypothetical protein [Mycolicibacterium helvum]